MRRFYIKGLVKVADTVRRSVAAPISAEQKARLSQLTSDSLAQVHQILASRGASVDHLPAPTRRAYQFLSDVDFDRVASTLPDAAHVRPQPSMTLPGLTSFWEGILSQLAHTLADSQAGKIHESIAAASESVRQQLAKDGLRANNLKRPSHQAFAWLTFFSIPQSFDAYIAAVRSAHPILRKAVCASPGCHSNLLLEFRPMSGLYRVRGYSDATRVVLPTPMISFDEALFRALASAIFGNGSKRTIIEAAQDEPFQAIQAELDALGGMVEHTAGVLHNLARSFDRVVSRYFNGELRRPRLTWNRTLTGRKFGHFDPITDTVMVSCTLDDANVEEFVVDFVMYHELLHKQLGADWRNGRQAVHTPEFRRREKLFEQYAAAEVALKQLAKKHA